LLKQLEKIHTQGYAVEREERNVGISAVAAPILNAKGNMVYSIGVVGIFNDLNPNEFRSTTSMVVRAAHSITEKLKC
jgi:DNA-binding IclR family transcriptional regulator